MDKFVINIGRQLGSGGKTVGEIIARRLGIKLYDKELINLAARESGLSTECFEHADEREAKGMFATLIGYFRAPFTGYEGGNTNNILANALKYSTGDLTVTLNREGVMTFSNRTAGMAAVDVQKLFDRYYTV